jgi:hypothetical protein
VTKRSPTREHAGWRALLLLGLGGACLGACDEERPPALRLVRDAGLDASARDAGRLEDGGLRSDGAIATDAMPEDGMDAQLVDDAGIFEGPWFEEVTTTSGLGFTRAAREALESLTDRMSGGVCVLDVDGIPPRDVFFANRPTAAGGSRLFMARGPLDYVERTAELGLGDVGDALACLAFDADGDGDDDLLVPGRGGVRLFENVGGRFTDKSERLPAVPATHLFMSAAAGDVDRDGDVDLFVAGFIDDDRTRLPETCSPFRCAADLGRFQGVPNLLLLRAPDGSYVNDVARLAPQAALAEMTLVVGIARMEGRGPVDLWVGNDYGSRFQDRPLRFDPTSRRFEDVSALIGLATNQRGYGTDTMGWSLGDVDGNGETDHVTSSFSDDATAVYLCADGFCEDRARSAGMDATAETFRWGEALGDFDLDGDLDLLETTGHVYFADELAPFGSRLPDDQPPLLLENRGGVFSSRAAAEGPAFSRDGQHRGIALVDLDEDGRLDVIMAPRDGAPIVLRNVHPPRGHWLRIALRGRGADRAAAGALVTVRHAGGSIVRQHVVGEGYLGNFDPRVHVGFPGDAPVDVEVLWPDGTTTRRSAVGVDTDITITQP